MGRSVPHNLKSTHQTEFVKIFNSLCGRYGRWEIWQDFITLAAIAISNTVDRSQAAEREKTYMTIARKYKPEEMLKFSQMLQEVVIRPESHSTGNASNRSSQTPKPKPARNGAAETNRPKMNLRKPRRPILNCARISSKSFRTAYSNST